jgi:hypothetical protein
LILQKIKASAIFIADVTRIGQSDEFGGEGNLKPLINPNVAIELGYALSTVGDAGLLMVMNKAYGGRETLPFDLSHKAGPIIYELNADASKAEIDAAKKRLVQQLKEAIRECAAALPENKVEVLPPAPYVPISPQDGPARFRPLSFAFIGWTARKNRLQASEFAPVRWTRFAPIHWTGACKRPETADLALVRSRSKAPKAVQ